MLSRTAGFPPSDSPASPRGRGASGRGRKPPGGFVIPLVVFLVFALGLFILSHSALNQGFQNQVRHMSRSQVLYNLAFSAYSRILARLFEKAWQDRFFRAGPAVETNVPLLEGTYDSFVIDAPNRPFQVDIYIQARTADQSQVFFWRILYVDDLLDISNRFYQILFSDLPPDSFPTGDQSPFATEVEKIIDERKKNHPQSLDIGRTISGLSTPQEIAEVIQAHPPGSDPIPDVPGGTPGTESPPKQTGIFPTTQVRTSVSPPVTSSAPEDISAGPVSIKGNGRETRVVKGNGTVDIAALATSGGAQEAFLQVRLFDPDGTEVLFQGKPLLTWDRKNDNEYFPAYFKGQEDTASMKFTDNWNGMDRTWSVDVREGQKLVFEVTAPIPQCYLKSTSSLL